METLTWEEKRAQEQTEKQAYRKLIVNIIEKLGWYVIPEEGDYAYPLVKAQNEKSGLTYFFRANNWRASEKGKIQVLAWFNVKTECGEVVGSDGPPSININMARPVKAICQDILRRLVPAAESHLSLLQHRKEQYDESNQARITNLEAVLNRPLTLEERNSQRVSKWGIEIRGETDGVRVSINYLSGPAAVTVAKALVESGAI